MVHGVHEPVHALCGPLLYRQLAVHGNMCIGFAQAMCSAKLLRALVTSVCFTPQQHPAVKQHLEAHSSRHSSYKWALAVALRPQCYDSNLWFPEAA